MPKGLLRVTGTLDISQFWPKGESDADTVKVTVDKIEFSPDLTAHLPFKTVHVFDNALLKGAQGAPKAPIRKGKLTIRLQGIDATELHFAAMLPKKGLPDNGTKYRQYFGEAAPVKLAQLLAKAKKTTMPCEVVTFVDHPNEVFDTYARMVGDVLVNMSGGQVNLNHWLAENGWALPTYYNSMLDTEIKTLQQLSNSARNAKKGIWKHLSTDIAHPLLSLKYRSPGTNPKPGADSGPAVMPKLFRRQVRYHVSHINNLFAGSVADFFKKQSDPWVKTPAFLTNPNLKPSATNLGALLNKQGKFIVGPGDIVFFEKPSTLIDLKGKKITAWS